MTPAAGKLDELVQRLRARASAYIDTHGNYLYYGEHDARLDRKAANEIERLTTAPASEAGTKAFPVRNMGDGAYMLTFAPAPEAGGDASIINVSGLPEAEIEDIKAHIRGLTEKRDTYEYELGSGWRCFHCGEMFRTPGGAKLHFGAPHEKPVCTAPAPEAGGDDETLARVIAGAVGYDYDTLYESKREWIDDRGSRHDINTPFKPDFREAAALVKTYFHSSPSAGAEAMREALKRIRDQAKSAPSYMWEEALAEIEMISHQALAALPPSGETGEEK